MKIVIDTNVVASGVFFGGAPRYIVSGDKDLLTLEKYDNVEIITAREFCDRYIS